MTMRSIFRRGLVPGSAAILATLPGGVTALPTVVAAATAVTGLLLAILVYVLASSRARAQAEVRQAIGELSASEANARGQADLLSAILDNISDGVGVVDAHGRFLLHNPAAKAILGVVADNDEGAGGWQQHYGMFLPDGHTPFPHHDMPLARALGGESSDQVEMIIRNDGHPDGVTISVSARPLHTAAGYAGAVAVFHDITVRKNSEAERAASAAALRRAHDELAGQKQYLTQVLDALQVAVLTCDTEGRIRHANRAAVARLGELARAGSQVRDILDALHLTHPDGSHLDAAEAPLLRALAGHNVNGEEIIMPTAIGTDSVLMHACALRSSTGAIIGAVESAYDISALREREADLRAFAAVAAHDLKAPLAAVVGYAEILKHDLIDGTEVEALQPPLQRITASVYRMSQLIDDLLAYATARDAHLELEAVDLQQVVADIITERTGHLRSSRDGVAGWFPDIYTGPLPTVRADQGLVRQLLDNLIGNSLKYTLPGQPARIDISAQDAAEPGMVRLTVADRGIGIPKEEQAHVFSSFHRAAAHTNCYAGTGLGLAICQRIVDRHGGTIGVHDNPGGGTCVQLTLPATAQAPHLPVHPGRCPEFERAHFSYREPRAPLG